MNNKKSILTLFLLLCFVLFYFNQSFSLTSLVTIWTSVLICLMSKFKNHFISLLLILEMLSLTSIFMMSLLAQNMNSTSLMLVLMTLSVGEAVLGLAILVKLARWSSTEFMLSGLN